MAVVRNAADTSIDKILNADTPNSKSVNDIEIRIRWSAVRYR